MLEVLAGWLGNSVNLSWLRRQICSPGRSPDDVDDLIHEAILRVAESCQREAVRDPAGILVRTVSRLSMNDTRDRARHPHVELEAEAVETMPALIEAVPMAEELMLAEQRWNLIAETLTAVSQRMREAFLLSRLHELTYAQIGRRLKVSERTVKADIAQVMALLIDAAHRKRLHHDER